MNITSTSFTPKRECDLSLVSLYPMDIQFYLIPPVGMLKLEEFELWALERLKVLKAIFQVNQKISAQYSEDWKNAIVEEIKNLGLKDWARLVANSGDGKTEQDLKMRRRDHISHFTLRFAYCRNPDLQNWFITHELILFKMRFLSLAPENIRVLLNHNNINLPTITNEEKSALENFLIDSSFYMNKEKLEKIDVYKLNFYQVPDLVRSRKVYVHKGIAYVPSYEIISYLSTFLKRNLSESLEMTRKKLFLFENDQRITDLMALVEESNEIKPVQLSAIEGSISPEEIDLLSRSVFPPCMRAMHQHLRTAHHLKHGGRLQYGLFLKGIGLGVEDALKFWREEFTRMMDPGKFDKEHVYGIRHIYGLEGKRMSKPPYGCDRLIETNLASGDRHGCPFKHYGQDALRNLLRGWGISENATSELINLATKRSYLPACSRYFEITQGVPPQFMISHPNLFYEDARKVQEGKNPISKAQVAKPKVNIMPKMQSFKNEILDDDMALMDLEIDEEMFSSSNK